MRVKKTSISSGSGGHLTYWSEGKWRYSVGGEILNPSDPKSCFICVERYECIEDVCINKIGSEYHDQCLGHIEGVLYACCGHGRPSRSYIMLEDRTVIRPIYCLLSNSEIPPHF